jgi:hypothetical protein
MADEKPTKAAAKPAPLDLPTLIAAALKAAAPGEPPACELAPPGCLTLRYPSAASLARAQADHDALATIPGLTILGSEQADVLHGEALVGAVVTLRIAPTR